MNTGRIIAAVAVLALVSGCASTPRVKEDPSFAPVKPKAAAEPQRATGAIYQARSRPASTRPLFEDAIAQGVGDLLTIRLVEQTEASKEASTTTGKSQEIGLESPTVFGREVTDDGTPILSGSVGAERDFDGNGESSQSNSLEGEITVTVAEVMANGNLVVRGEKILSLNQGDEYVRFSGIVRPEDIQPDNTVLSTKVANPRIAYGGSGVIDDANSMGWLARFFNSAIWPF
ncbi:MAG TPA: flagellar basal body L-ring protein FlgH [Gammaproteobacteria bacterium]|nr:flagellar basal body L-ring protein FlgH [Gammaproteobacteria bacterium]